MKPQPISCDTPAIHECKRVVGGRLRQVFQATIAVIDDNNNKSSDPTSEVYYIENVKRPNRRVNIEDPIRTIMFLGSWSHT
ncbi:hypothetical protein SSX86_026034 [Deinandra increscens subsp. villosa]|uniref:Uncharacterized protein n=1 Tax=Deinandra increscens subsp. villosa TaxID=3103831 RepID=A0AAP0CED0_9ASTR